MTVPYADFDVAVPAGTVHVGRWGPPDARHTILAVHGITATHRAWLAVANHLPPGTAIVAPDLRGRGASSGGAGPYGLATHADDLARLLDHVGLERATIAGHSMGASVATVMADRHPDRVDRLVLVDGGLPLSDERPPPDVDIEALVHAAIGPSLDRLDMTFASPEGYLDFWRVHPAWHEWSAYAEDAFLYDLVPTMDGAAFRSGVDKPAIIADGGSMLVGDDLPDAVARLRHPTTLIHAERGMFDQVPPLYPADVVARWQTRLPGLRTIAVPGTNHYTVVMSDLGATAVAAALLTASS